MDESERKSAISTKISNQVIEAVKASLLFQPNFKWEEMIGAAPYALHSMGICYVVASAKIASQVMIKIPRDSKIKYPSLRASLIQASSIGSEAFEVTHIEMDKINRLSGNLYSSVQDAAECLGSPDESLSMLIRHMSTIKETAEECLASAIKIDNRFHEWMVFMGDLHGACEDSSAETSKDIKDIATKIRARKAFEEQQENAVKIMEDAAQKFEEEMDKLMDMYQDACDKVPTGLSLLFQDFVQGFSEAFQSITNTLLGRSTRRGGRGSTETRSNDDQVNLSQKVGAVIQVDSSTMVSGYDLVSKLVKEALAGSTEIEQVDIDTGSFLRDMLDCSIEGFDNVNSGDPESEYKGYLQSSSDVLSEVLDEPEGRDAAKWTTNLQNHEKALRKNSEKILELKAKYDAQAGQAPGGIPLTKRISKNKGSSSHSVAKASAQTQVESALEASRATQEMYNKSLELLGDRKAELARTKVILQTLAAEELDLEAIKKTIEQCIKPISGMKVQIGNLCRFFSGLANMMEVVVKTGVRSYLRNIMNLRGREFEDEDEDEPSLGGFTLSDISRQQVFSSVVQIRAYFSVFADVAKMWMHLSTTSIKPGIALCDEMSKFDDAISIEQKQKELDIWSDTAEAEVTKLASETQKQILQGMSQRLASIEEETKMLGPSPVKEAIENGSRAAQESGKRELSKRFNNFGDDDD